jgi:hypothetical protein
MRTGQNLLPWLVPVKEPRSLGDAMSAITPWPIEIVAADPVACIPRNTIKRAKLLLKARQTLAIRYITNVPATSVNHKLPSKNRILPTNKCDSSSTSV